MKYCSKPMTEHNTKTRAVAGKAHVSILMDDVPDVGSYPLVVPTDDDVDQFDLGDLVGDRIEGHGKVTLPDPEQRPEPGERMYLGLVTWDGDGLPIRLERLDVSLSIEFDENGHVLQVTDHGGKE